jgi:hypothetical protein
MCAFDRSHDQDRSERYGFDRKWCIEKKFGQSCLARSHYFSAVFALRSCWADTRLTTFVPTCVSTLCLLRNSRHYKETARFEMLRGEMAKLIGQGSLRGRDTFM